MTSEIDRLRDRSRTIEERVAAAEALGAALAKDLRAQDEWSAVCTVLFDGEDDVRVRKAALQAMVRQGPKAPNVLTRVFDNDVGRELRKDALAALKQLGVHPIFAKRLDEELGRSDRLQAYANLAITFGHDGRIIAALRSGAADPDVRIRAVSLLGLGALGELDPVMAALDDPSADVRLCAVQSLGAYSTLRDVEIRALGRGLTDADSKVQRAAKAALKQLGIHPAAAPPSRRGKRGV